MYLLVSSAKRKYLINLLIPFLVCSFEFFLAWLVGGVLAAGITCIFRGMVVSILVPVVTFSRLGFFFGFLRLSSALLPSCSCLTCMLSKLLPILVEHIGLSLFLALLFCHSSTNSLSCPDTGSSFFLWALHHVSVPLFGCPVDLVALSTDEDVFFGGVVVQVLL